MDISPQHACTLLFALAPHITHYARSSHPYLLFSLFFLYRTIAIPWVQICRNWACAYLIPDIGYIPRPLHLCSNSKPRRHWLSLNNVFTQVQCKLTKAQLHAHTHGPRWSRSSWQMSYSIHWCLGSYIGVWGSAMHLDTSLHHVCMISVFTTTSFCVYMRVGHLAPLHLVMRVVFVSPMWFSTHPFWVPPLLWLLRIRTTFTLFRTHPSLSMQQSTGFLPVSSSTLFYQPLCSSPACLSPVFTVL